MSARNTNKLLVSLRTLMRDLEGLDARLQQAVQGLQTYSQLLQQATTTRFPSSISPDKWPPSE